MSSFMLLFFGIEQQPTNLIQFVITNKALTEELMT